MSSPWATVLTGTCGVAWGGLLALRSRVVARRRRSAAERRLRALLPRRDAAPARAAFTWTFSWPASSPHCRAHRALSDGDIPGATRPLRACLLLCARTDARVRMLVPGIACRRDACAGPVHAGMSALPSGGRRGPRGRVACSCRVPSGGRACVCVGCMRRPGVVCCSACASPLLRWCVRSAGSNAPAHGCVWCGQP